MRRIGRRRTGLSRTRWEDAFIGELEHQAQARFSRLNVSLACDLAGVHRSVVYRYIAAEHEDAQRLRQRWEAIELRVTRRGRAA